MTYSYRMHIARKSKDLFPKSGYVDFRANANPIWLQAPEILFLEILLTFSLCTFTRAVCPPTLTWIESLVTWKTRCWEGIHTEHFMNLAECDKPQRMLQQKQNIKLNGNDHEHHVHIIYTNTMCWFTLMLYLCTGSYVFTFLICQWRSCIRRFFFTRIVQTRTTCWKVPCIRKSDPKFRKSLSAYFHFFINHSIHAWLEIRAHSPGSSIPDAIHSKTLLSASPGDIFAPPLLTHFSTNNSIACDKNKNKWMNTDNSNKLPRKKKQLEFSQMQLVIAFYTKPQALN